MRLISFALTEAQLLDGSKTVTRRQVGSPRSVWHRIKPGDRLRAVDKAMGLKRGQKPRELGIIEVVSIRLERLDAITDDDCAREGFPEMRAEFVVLLLAHEVRAEPAGRARRVRSAARRGDVKARLHWIAWLTRAPAHRWQDRGPLRSRVRRWILHTVLRYEGESCDACGGAVEAAWWCDDDDWRAAYRSIVSTESPIAGDGSHVHQGLLCMRCFSIGMSRSGRGAVLWRSTSMTPPT